MNALPGRGIVSRFARKLPHGSEPIATLTALQPTQTQMKILQYFHDALSYVHILFYLYAMRTELKKDR
jgi:hypothetical protein